MDSETRNCQNCKKDFVIESDDFSFYEKIKAPPPTWCPECRQMRRYSWRNERILYRRNCDLCGKSTVTIYSQNKPYKVYCPPCWWSDNWSALDYGQDFDFSKPFFPQFQDLQLKVPRIALLGKNSVNSEYTNHSNNNKNCYLSFGVFDSENLMYCNNVWNTSRDCVDLYRNGEGAELCYECIDAFRIYKCQYGWLLRDCTECFYCFDCRGCSNCFLSSNLRNKQYHILNKPYSKDEYFEKIKEFKLGSFSQREKLYEEYLKLMRDFSLHRFATIERLTGVSGNAITDSKNSYHVFDADSTEDSKFVIVCPDVKDSMDSYHFGFKTELVYESHAMIHSYKVMFSHLSYDDSHIQYCDTCHNSENLFGCVGLKKANYCIFNKNYSESEYKALEEKIIEHMKKTGEYGEFFPPQISPFGYNETQGQVYMPLTKEEVLSRGWKWEDRVPGTFGKETIKPENISDAIDDISDSIINEALRCIKCTKNYNVISPELQFYKREKIPVPRLCPSCRYERRIALRSPRKLWRRKCMKPGCSNEFETPYAPERPEIVYCERCYNEEVA